MKKKKIVIIICIILILLCCFLFVEIESHQANKKINNFIERGIYVATINKIEYYKVVKKYDYEDTTNVIDNFEDIYVGSIGDVYISSKDPLDFFVTKYLSKRLRFGHAAIVQSEDAKTMVEVVGNSKKENNIIREVDNTWLEKKTEEITVLRVKNIDPQIKQSLQDDMRKMYGLSYNYLFLIHAKNRYYCLDLCSRIYEGVGVDIDGKPMITLGSSMIKDNDTYIIYYKKKIKSDNANYQVYYLSEE